MRIFDVLDAQRRNITAVKESASLYSFRVGLLSVYFSDLVGLQLKESFQHYMISKAASQKDRNTRPRGYKTFFMLNLNEREFSTAHETKLLTNKKKFLV